MRLPTLLILTASFLATSLLVPLAAQNQFVDLLTRDPSTTNAAGHLCYATNGRVDIGCPATAPYISTTTGYVGIGTTTPNSNLHISDTNARLRIGGATNGYLYINGASNSANLTMTSGNNSNFTMSGDTASFVINTGASNYIGTMTASTYALRSNNLNRMLVLSSGPVNVVNSFSINTGNSYYYPFTSLDVSGTLRLSNSGESCDTNRLGAFKYQSNAFYICQNTSNGWEPLATTGTSSNNDRIISGTTQAIAYTNTSLSLVTNGTERMVIGTTGSVGIGIATPTAKLDVSGSIKVAGEASEGCSTASDYGKIRLNPTTGNMQICMNPNR